MLNLLYVAVPVAFGIFVSALWAGWSRVRANGMEKRSMEHGMSEFSRELTALSPGEGRERRRAARRP